MKHRNIPDYKEKQRLLYLGRTASAELSALGDRYASAGRIADAIECYGRAGDAEKLRSIQGRVEEDGDVQFILQIQRALGREAAQDEWDRIGRRALEKGRLNFARQAFEKSGNSEGLREVQEADRRTAGGGGHS